MKTRRMTPDNREHLEHECAGCVARHMETFGLEADDAETHLLRELLRAAHEVGEHDLATCSLDELLERVNLPDEERELIVELSTRSATARRNYAGKLCKQLREHADWERKQRKLEQAVGDGDHERARAIVSSAPRPDTPKASRIGVWRGFPTETLPPILSDFVAEHARCKGVDPSMIALPLLGAVAGAIGNSLAVEARADDDWREPVALWIGVIVRSGGTKSPSAKAALKPLSDIQKRYFKQAKDANRGRQNGEDMEKPRRIIVDDVTPEKLLAILEENPRGLLRATDELAELLGSIGRYRSGRGAAHGETAQLCRLYDGGAIEYDRKNSGHLHIPKVLASIVGTIPVETWRQLATRDFQTSGLLARFCVAMPPTKPSKYDVDPLDWRAGQAVFSLFERLLAEPCEPDDATGDPRGRLLGLDADARRAFGPVHDDLKVKAHSSEGLAASATNKAPGLLLRVAAILHACGDRFEDDRIDGETMRRAIALSDWIHSERLRVFAMLETDAETAKRAELVASLDWSRYPDGITANELRKDRKTTFEDADDAERLLRACVEDGLLCERFGTRGNPAQGGRETLIFTHRDNPQTETAENDDE